MIRIYWMDTSAPAALVMYLLEVNTAQINKYINTHTCFQELSCHGFSTPNWTTWVPGGSPNWPKPHTLWNTFKTYAKARYNMSNPNSQSGFEYVYKNMNDLTGYLNIATYPSFIIVLTNIARYSDYQKPTIRFTSLRAIKHSTHVSIRL